MQNQDPLSTDDGAEEAEPLWYARSSTCGSIIDVLSALEGTPTNGGAVGPQAAVEISKDTGLQIRVLEGSIHVLTFVCCWHAAALQRPF